MGPGEGGARRLGRHTAVLIGLAAVVVAIAMAYRWRWLCDDAFISFRYARNLVEGRGLVFNEGERVEGYTNFLWTLGCAAALALGIRQEIWVIAAGIASYAACVALLVLLHLRLRRVLQIVGPSVPIAAVLAALHQDWSIYATSGLETSFFTLLLLSAFLLLALTVEDGRPRPLGVALLLAAAALTRPDALVFVAVAATAIGMMSRRSPAALVRFVVFFAVPYGAFLAWRLWYYGDLVPNTYYAKSAGQAWWAQGWLYLRFYFEKYALLLGGVGVGAAALVSTLQRRPESDADRIWRETTLLALAFALPFTIYIARLGGDFMFARMLIPVAPFYLVLLDLGLLRWVRRPVLLFPAVGLAIAAITLPPYPIAEEVLVNGIANEWSFYQRTLLDEADDSPSATLRRYFDGLPVRVAFVGSGAHLVERARIPVAIEAETGLTDRFIARQEIGDRRRVGHEKHAPPDYLVRARGLHFAIPDGAVRILQLDKAIPAFEVKLDDVTVMALHWDPPIMAELRRRGAVFGDLPTQLDRLIRDLDRYSDSEVADFYAQLRLFYFDFVDDPERENAIRTRLHMAPANPS